MVVMLGHPPIAMELTFWALFALAIWRAGQILWSLRRQWTIADWFCITFWLGLVLAVFANS